MKGLLQCFGHIHRIVELLGSVTTKIDFIFFRCVLECINMFSTLFGFGLFRAELIRFDNFLNPLQMADFQGVVGG